jgi:hypothetical protein
MCELGIRFAKQGVEEALAHTCEPQRDLVAAYHEQNVFAGNIIAHNHKDPFFSRYWLP